MTTEPPSVILLYRAILTLAALPDPDARYFQVTSAWPTYARRYLDAYNPDEDTEIAWRPTPADVTAYLGVLTWARELTKRQWHIMRLRARDYSLPLIADMLRISLEHALDAHAEAVHAVSVAARRAEAINPQNAPAAFPARMNATSGARLLTTHS